MSFAFWVPGARNSKLKTRNAKHSFSMRKYTNVFLLSGLTLFVGAMLVSALKLNQILVHTDLKDPYRNFDKHELPPFRCVSFELGRILQPGEWQGFRHSHSGKIEQAPERVLYISKKLADSVHWEIKNDTLFVRGANSRVSVSMGAVLRCPDLSALSVSIGEMQVLDGQYDSLQIWATHGGEVKLKRTAIRALNLSAQAHSSFALDSNATAHRLRLDLGPGCSFSSLDAVPTVFDWTADATASLKFKGKSQALVRQ